MPQQRHLVQNSVQISQQLLVILTALVRLASEIRARLICHTTNNTFITYYATVCHIQNQQG
jgi:hypothetical protein